MITVSSAVYGGCLRIACTGSYGMRSEGNLSDGRLVQDVLERSLIERGHILSEVIIDFTQVKYVSGNGPIWSVMKALSRGLRVTYIARKETGDALQKLLSGTGMSQLIHIVVDGSGGTP